MPIYEELLSVPFDEALREASMHFEEKSAVHEAVRKVTRHLDRLGVPYALAGAMAMFAHGFRRFTEDVDLLVTAEGLATIHRELEGRGYLPPFAGSKNLRDTEHGVRIEFLVTGGFPGDGKPKPVVFPNPQAAHEVIGGVSVLPLRNLIELKLASGISNLGRLKDLADVQEMIRVLSLSLEFGDDLSEYVREKYRELWRGVRSDAAAE